MDPGDEICDALVGYLNGLQVPDDSDEYWDSPFEFTFKAFHPDDVHEELKREQADLKVMFGSYGDVEEAKLDKAGTTTISVPVTMIVARRINDGITRKKLNKLVWDIRQSLRGYRPANYVWTTGETLVKADKLQISESMMYATEFQFNYIGNICPNG